MGSTSRTSLLMKVAAKVSAHTLGIEIWGYKFDCELLRAFPLLSSVLDATKVVIKLHVLAATQEAFAAKLSS